jgi:hypothetical protein
MRYLTRGLFWIAVYLGLALFPCLVLLSGNMPPGYGYLWDFSLTLGYGAASMIAVVFDASTL